MFTKTKIDNISTIPSGFVVYCKAILAGILIGISCITFASAPNKLTGSFLFSFGFLAIGILDVPLFTGRIGYTFSKLCGKESPGLYLLKMLVVWTGNLVGTNLVSYLFIPTTQFLEVEEKLDIIAKNTVSMSIGQLLCLSIICGMFVFVCMESWIRSKRSVLGAIVIILTSMCFIHVGGLHCIAMMFFIYAAKSIQFVTIPNFDIWPITCILLVTLGNTIGAWIMSLSTLYTKSYVFKEQSAEMLTLFYKK